MLWFTKKEENVSQSLIKRVVELENRVLSLESQILSVQMDQKVIRDKVLRKIQFKKDESDTPQDIYKGMLIPQSS